MKVADFSLDDYRGKRHALADYKDSKLVVIALLGTECPLAKLYGPRLAELSKKYADQGVTVLGVNANQQDSLAEIAAYARNHKIEFPILKDAGGRVVEGLGATRTPEVFLLDEKRVVRYRGRIDDQYGVGYVRKSPQHTELSAAIDELLAGKPVSRPVTEPAGCLIGKTREPKKGAAVTYSNQVARIFQKRCVECHREGEIAPFALTEYSEAAGWAPMIAEVVREERMPPWHASPEHGHFANERRLTDEEKQTIFAWVESGAPQGDAKDLPPPRTFTTGWQLPEEPDVVVAIADKPVSVQAEGVVRYQYFRADLPFAEEKWIRAAEILPGNRAVVHHVLVFARPKNSRGGVGEGAVRGFLVGYVPGLRQRPFPDGMAKRIPANSELIFQVHYTPVGSPQTDLTKIGFVFADPDKVTREVKTTSAVGRMINIPPGAENHRITSITLRPLSESLLLGFMPHMHVRGKSFHYEAWYPDGRKEVLLDVPRYDFNWQTSYRLDEPQKLPAGTRMYCVAHFDNSEKNLNNPDPTKTVRWGDQTWDEMMIGYFDIAVPRDTAPDEPVLPSDRDDEAQAVQGSPREQAENIVNQFDADGDGKLTRDELSEEGKRIFDRVDQDKSGDVTVEELTKVLERARGR
ncbi:MAG: redoxin domain-containing protein [Planctomycetia bacterium]|nr:redoxin domain-containing protein [Planctomycetia bacterium]